MLYVTRIFILSIFFSLSLFAQTKDACIAYYRNGSAMVGNYISFSNSNKTFLKKTAWLKMPQSDPLLNEHVLEAIQFSEAERVKAIEVIKSQKVKDGNLREILLLSSYDKNTWIAFLKRAMRGPLQDDSLVNALIPVVRNMPLELRQDLLEIVKPRYQSLSKRNVSIFPPKMNLRLAPKRSIDALFLHLFPAKEWIELDMQTSGNALVSYDRYLKFLKETLFDQATNGGYSASDVVGVAERVQAVLRANASEISRDATIWITGSFPNGRAKVKNTDLDSQLSEGGLKALFPEINFQINSAAKNAGLDRHFKIEAMWESTTPHFAAQINPIFLKITKDTISLDIYSAVQPHFKDKALIPQNYEPPTSFVLKAEASLGSILGDSNKSLKMDVSKAVVSKAVETKFQGYDVNTNWMALSSKSPEVEALVRSILLLTPGERMSTLGFLNRYPKDLKKLDTILRLALYDKAAWDEYFDRFSSTPEPTDALFNSLMPIIEKMPTELKEHLVKRVTEQYPTVSRKKWVLGITGRNFKTIAPKRALDILVNQLVPAQKYISEQIQKGDDAVTAYDKFIRHQHNTVYPNLAVGSYPASLVLEVAKVIQADLRKYPKKANEEELIIAGSFPNGRANLKKSDIDVQIPNTHYEDLIPTLHKSVNEYLKTSSHPTTMEVNSMFLTTTRINAGLVSPVQIRITRDEIRLEVYKPIRNIDRDEVQLPKNYEKPMSIMLSLWLRIEMYQHVA